MRRKQLFLCASHLFLNIKVRCILNASFRLWLDLTFVIKLMNYKCFNSEIQLVNYIHFREINLKYPHLIPRFGNQGQSRAWHHTTVGHGGMFSVVFPFPLEWSQRYWGALFTTLVLLLMELCDILIKVVLQ